MVAKTGLCRLTRVNHIEQSSARQGLPGVDGGPGQAFTQEPNRSTQHLTALRQIHPHHDLIAPGAARAELYLLMGHLALAQHQHISLSLIGAHRGQRYGPDALVAGLESALYIQALTQLAAPVVDAQIGHHTATGTLGAGVDAQQAAMQHAIAAFQAQLRSLTDLELQRFGRRHISLQLEAAGIDDLKHPGIDGQPLAGLGQSLGHPT